MSHSTNWVLCCTHVKWVHLCVLMVAYTSTHTYTHTAANSNICRAQLHFIMMQWIKICTSCTLKWLWKNFTPVINSVNFSVFFKGHNHCRQTNTFIQMLSICCLLDGRDHITVCSVFSSSQSILHDMSRMSNELILWWCSYILKNIGWSNISGPLNFKAVMKKLLF